MLLIFSCISSVLWSIITEQITKKSLEKLPPFNLDAEQAVLGAILLDNNAIFKALEIFHPSDFYRPSHQKIFQAMLSLNERGDVIDLLLLRDELERRGDLEHIGGPAYLVSLVDVVPTAANIEFHVRIVHEKAIARRLLNSSIEIATRCYDDSEEVSRILEDAEQKIFEISEGQVKQAFTPLNEIVKQSYQKIEELAEAKSLVTGVPTGFVELDRMTSGFQPSDLIILAARPAMGKTSFCLNVAHHIGVKANIPTAIFSLEMSKEQLGIRLLCGESRLDSQRVRIGDLEADDWERLTHASEILSKAPIYIDDTAAISILEMRAKAKRLKMEKGLGVIIVDYLQLMQPRSPRENRQQEITEISRSLKQLAKEIHVPVIALSQLSRAVESRTDKRPQLSDLRESGCLAGDTLIYHPQTGEHRPLRDMLQTPSSVLSLNQATWKVEHATPSNVFCTGEKPVFQLITQSGRSVKATANHKFLTITGWKRLDELSVGDAVATPRTLPQKTQPTISVSQLALLGHLIGDGCTLPHHAIQYTTCDSELAQTVVQLAQEAFGEAITPRIHHEIVPKRSGQWFQVFLTASEHLTHRQRNPIAEWLDSMGVWGLRSYEKCIPSIVFQQPSQSIALFLRHLWSTDGCIGLPRQTEKKGAPIIYYATSSHQLAKDVQSLLLTISINARLSRIPQTGKGRDQYHVTISGKDDILKFIHNIGIVGNHRHEKVQAVLKFYRDKIGNTNRDLLPKETWRHFVVPAMRDQGITTRQFQALLGHKYCGTSLYKTGISRERAAKIANVLNNPPFKQLAESDVYWDKISSITAAGTELVYDITVPEHHNFVANNIIVHNSIEQDADIVMFIYRPDVYFEDAPEGIAEIIIGKQRNGPVGTVQLAFIKQYTRFENLETHHDHATPESGNVF